MKILCFAVSLIVLPLCLFADKTPKIFYLASSPVAQVGVIRNFDDDQVQVLHDRIQGSGIKAAVHPGGRYVLSMTTSGFEHFDFGDTGHYFIFGTTEKGAVGWTVPETNFRGKDYEESAPRFSQDGEHFYTTVTYRKNSIVSAYDFRTGASERLFWNRWPKKFYRGIPLAALTSDGKKAVFFSVRGRRTEIYTWPLQSVTNEAPSLLLKLAETPEEFYAGKNLLVYKITKYLRRGKKQPILAFYDTRISENYRIFPYSETYGNIPDGNFAVDEKNRMLYTVNRSEEKSRIYRINMHTLKVDPLVPNALKIYDVSRDGRYLLYTRYRDEAELAGPAKSWEDKPQIVTVLDLETREIREMELPGLLSYSCLAFTYN